MKNVYQTVSGGVTQCTLTLLSQNKKSLSLFFLLGCKNVDELKPTRLHI